MKNSYFIIVVLLSFTGTANAQVFKKLGNKITRAAEKAVERKAVQKTTRETEDAFDAAFNKEGKNKGNRSGAFGLTSAEPEKTYAFNFKASMKMTSGKDVMNLDYYLPKSGNFFGTKIKDGKIRDDFFTVFDADKEAMFTYMKNEGKKIRTGVDFKTDNTADDTDIVTIQATGNTKTILGYSCEEYAMKGKDMTGIIWVTREVDIRFPSNLYLTQQRRNNNQEWMKNVDGWAMEMEMTDSSKRKPQIISMKCLSIEPSDFKINSSNYQPLGL